MVEGFTGSASRCGAGNGAASSGGLPNNPVPRKTRQLPSGGEGQQSRPGLAGIPRTRRDEIPCRTLGALLLAT